MVDIMVTPEVETTFMEEAEVVYFLLVLQMESEAVRLAGIPCTQTLIMTHSIFLIQLMAVEEVLVVLQVVLQCTAAAAAVAFLLIITILHPVGIRFMAAEAEALE